MGQKNEEQRADRMDEIMDAAVKLFAKKGYHATSISDISEAVGLGRGALYYYILSKEDLLWEIHKRHVDPLLEATIQLEQQPLTPEEKLRAVSRQLIGIITTYLPYMIVFYREIGALSPERMAKLVESAALMKIASSVFYVRACKVAIGRLRIHVCASWHFSACITGRFNGTTPRDQ